MIFKPCGSFQLSGYQRVHLAGRWHSPSRSGGGQSILRERRKPVREEVTIRPVQGFPDPLSQLRRGVDVVGIPVGQRGDPIRQREGCRQRPDPRDYGQPGRQVGQKPAPVAGPVRGAPVDAEWWAGDPINLPSALLILKDGALQPSPPAPVVCPARSAVSASCQDALYDPLTLDFVDPFRNVQHPARSCAIGLNQAAHASAPDVPARSMRACHSLWVA
jgi:hypothetical protein